MGVSNVPAASAAGLQPKYQKFTSSGTFTLPTGYGPAKPLLVNIQVIGGGGAGSGAANTANNGNYLGNVRFINYFGSNGTWRITGSSIETYSTSQDGAGGGSGGLCQTQMYLTENLSITVGAAGARTRNTYTYTTSNNVLTNGHPQGRYTITNFNISGGSGGTTTAGVLQATGGAGGNTAYNIRSAADLYEFNGNTPYDTNTEMGGYTTTNGGGGTPAGTAGSATPLLGTLAGGSGSTTPIRGSFGIGGIKTDGTTSTGADGTGGGHDSNGASGAVILTWWE